MHRPQFESRGGLRAYKSGLALNQLIADSELWQPWRGCGPDIAAIDGEYRIAAEAAPQGAKRDDRSRCKAVWAVRVSLSRQVFHRPSRAGARLSLNSRCTV